MEKTDRISKTWVGVTTGTGLLVVLVGLWVGDFDDDAFSGLLIEIGAGIGLIGIIVLMERSMIGRVSKATTDAIDRSTDDLRERIGQLENLDREQATEGEKAKSSEDAQIRRVREDELTASSVKELIVSAHEDKLTSEQLRVRTSDEPDCNVLHVLASHDPNGKPAIWLDFEPLSMSDYLTDLDDGSEIWIPQATASTVIWINDLSAAKIGADLESALRRQNLPMNGFSFSFALSQLAESIEMMRCARRADASDPLRLKGSLDLLINPEWVLTSHGLEGVHNNYAFKTTRVPSPLGIQFLAAHVRISQEPTGQDLAGWRAALSWLEDQEGFEVLYGDQSPTTPFGMPN